MEETRGGEERAPSPSETKETKLLTNKKTMCKNVLAQDI